MNGFLFEAHWSSRKKARISQRAEVRRLVRNGGQGNSRLPLEVVSQRLNVINARVRRHSLGDLGKRRVRDARFIGNYLDLTFAVIKSPQHEI